MKTQWLGPSHIVRLEQAVKTEQVFLPHDPIFIAAGGLPSWSNKVQSFKHFSNSDSINYVIGDFRFGNTIFSAVKTIDMSVGFEFNKNFTGISKEFIDLDRDRQLLNLSLFALDRLIDKFQNSIKLLFWDLFIREYENRKNEKYYINGKYHHPTWNLKEINKMYTKNSPDLSSLLGYNSISSLYVDKNAHPSLKGFLFMSKVFEGISPEKALEISNDLQKELTVEIFAKLDKKIAISGQSSFCKSVQSLQSQGSIILPSGCFFVDRKEIVNTLKSGTPVYYFPPLRNDCDLDIDQWFEKIKSNFKEIELYSEFSHFRVVFWDSWARESISFREEAYRWFRPTSYLRSYAFLENSFPEVTIKLSRFTRQQMDSMIELNVGLQPTQKGIFMLFKLIENGRFSLIDEMQYTSILKKHFLGK